MGTYLFTIARTAAVDIRRRPSSRPHDPAPDADDDAFVTGDDVERLMEGLTVRDALESLTTAHRTVLGLAYTDGLTHRQIATKLGIPLGTVKTRMFHGLRALRMALEERGVDA